MSNKYPLLLTGVGKDDQVDAAEKFVCLSYGIEEEDAKGIDNARHILFCECETWPRDVASNPIRIRVKVTGG